jgi:hypothetical protein
MKPFSKTWMVDEILKAKRQIKVYTLSIINGVPVAPGIYDEDAFISESKRLMNEMYAQWPGELPRGEQQATEERVSLFPELLETITAGTKRYNEATTVRTKATSKALKEWFEQLAPHFDTQYRYRSSCYTCYANQTKQTVVEFVSYKGPAEISYEDVPPCSECKCKTP